MKKASQREPSKASLKEMPDMTGPRFRPLGRGLYAERARRSFGSVLVDRAVLDRLGGEEAAAKLLEAVADSLGTPKKAPKRSSKKAAA